MEPGSSQHGAHSDLCGRCFYKDVKMKRFKFVMDDGTSVDILAQDFRSAGLIFDQMGLDPREIWAVEER